MFTSPTASRYETGCGIDGQTNIDWQTYAPDLKKIIIQKIIGGERIELSKPIQRSTAELTARSFLGLSYRMRPH
jgi:hypothetical protein